jgi:hypothetical protein
MAKYQQSVGIPIPKQSQGDKPPFFWSGFRREVAFLCFWVANATFALVILLTYSLFDKWSHWWGPFVNGLAAGFSLYMVYFTLKRGALSYRLAQAQKAIKLMEEEKKEQENSKDSKAAGQINQAGKWIK